MKLLSLPMHEMYNAKVINCHPHPPGSLKLTWRSNQNISPYIPQSRRRLIPEVCNLHYNCR